MNPLIRLALGLVLLVVVAAGCSRTASPLGGPEPGDKSPVVEEGKKSLFAKNIFFETKGDRRYVLISAAVAYQPGQFCEYFLCRKDTKEYESVLVADVEPLRVHEALLAARAKSGSPVQYEPKFRPPQGDKIKVTLQWEENGRRKSVPAQSWLRDRKTRQEMACDWVFAGSIFEPNPLDTKGAPTYLANLDGIVMTLANFQTAVLDVSILSAAQRDLQEFEAFDEHIPAAGTKVSVILEPVGK
jgi:hypothetical protein